MKFKKQPFVSIIVPVYNVEKYLSKCIDSIINQSLENIEIILVNDGSPDNCPRICDEYASKDNRIKVIHKVNGGLSSARNAGIKVATGDYIGFVDSDDFIELNMYEQMYKVANENDVDFVMSDYYKVHEGDRKEVTLNINSGIYKKDDIENKIYPNLIMKEDIDYGPLLAVWHCLYKTSFIKKNNLYFDEVVKYSEDNLFSSLVGYKANSFYYMKGYYLYNYMYNPNSISTTYKPDSWNVYSHMNNKLYDNFYNNEDFDFKRQLDLHMIYYIFNYINQLGNSNESFSYKYKNIKDILNSKESKRALNKFRIPNVGIKLKICILMLKYRLIFPYMIIRKDMIIRKVV